MENGLPRKGREGGKPRPPRLGTARLSPAAHLQSLIDSVRITERNEREVSVSENRVIHKILSKIVDEISLNHRNGPCL